MSPLLPGVRNLHIYISPKPRGQVGSLSRSGFEMDDRRSGGRAGFPHEALLPVGSRIVQNAYAATQPCNRVLRGLFARITVSWALPEVESTTRACREAAPETP